MTIDFSYLARPISSAPQHPQARLLAYCPDSGGWQTATWFESTWVDSATLMQVLEPTYWIPLPSHPTRPCKRQESSAVHHNPAKEKVFS